MQAWSSAHSGSESMACEDSEVQAGTSSVSGSVPEPSSSEPASVAASAAALPFRPSSLRSVMRL